MPTRPVWVEISRHNLVANYRELCRIAHDRALPGSEPAVLAVVKANAYGHGMCDCAPPLVKAGAEWIGVTSVDEGVAARAVCPQAKILIMSGIWHCEADAVIEHRLTPIVWEHFHLDLLEETAKRHILPPLSIPVHLEIDTGMSRQGVHGSGEILRSIVNRFRPESVLKLDGVATHFSAPEVLDSGDTDRQRERFEAALETIALGRHRPGWLHAGNSATILRGEQLAPLRRAASGLGAKLMLRPGLSLYGYAPRFTEDGRTASLAEAAGTQLQPVLTWKTRVTSLHTIQPGGSAGYNSTFHAIRPTILALLPMGYADGLSRQLSNRGSVLVRGQRAPIVGRVSMDQTIFDVTEIDGVEIGDEVVVLGSQGSERISAYDVADLTGTIPYEILCGINWRVPRILVD